MMVTFDAKVTYKDINLRGDHIGVVIADDKRTASSDNLWLVRWSKPSDVVGVEHASNLLVLDELAVEFLSKTEE